MLPMELCPIHRTITADLRPVWNGGPSPKAPAGAVFGLCNLRNVFPGLNSCDGELGERRRQETLFFFAAKITRQTIRNVVLAGPATKLRQRGVRVTPHMLRI